MYEFCAVMHGHNSNSYQKDSCYTFAVYMNN